MADTDTSQQTDEPRKNLTPAQRAAGKHKTKEGDKEPGEKGPLEILRDQAGTMLIALLVVVGVLLFVVYQSGEDRDFNNQAWSALAELDVETERDPGKYEEAAQRYRESNAIVYIELGWASALYETGERAKVEKALEIYQRLQRDHKGHALLESQLPQLIEDIGAELKDPRAPLREPKDMTSDESAGEDEAADDDVSDDGVFEDGPPPEEPGSEEGDSPSDDSAGD